MVKKPSKASGAPTGGGSSITESNIDQVEKRTIVKVSHTITVLEGALATWDAAKKKPEHLLEKFKRYRRFHSALTKWEKNALKAQRKKESFDERVGRLKEFVNICYSYG